MLVQLQLLLQLNIITLLLRFQRYTFRNNTIKMSLQYIPFKFTLCWYSCIQAASRTHSQYTLYVSSASDVTAERRSLSRFRNQSSLSSVLPSHDGDMSVFHDAVHSVAGTSCVVHNIMDLKFKSIKKKKKSALIMYPVKIAPAFSFSLLQIKVYITHKVCNCIAQLKTQSS